MLFYGAMTSVIIIINYLSKQ